MINKRVRRPVCRPLFRPLFSSEPVRPRNHIPAELIKDGSDLSTSNWGKRECTISGTDGIVGSTRANYVHDVFQDIDNIERDIFLTVSAKVKEGNLHWVSFYMNSTGASAIQIYYDVQNLICNGPNFGDIIDYGLDQPDPDGFVRVWMRVLTKASGASILYVSPSESDGDNSYTGDGTTVDLYVKNVSVSTIYQSGG